MPPRVFRAFACRPVRAVIGDIVGAALVLTHFERGYTTSIR